MGENIIWCVLWASIAMIISVTTYSCNTAVGDKSVAVEKSFQTAVESGMPTEELKKLFYRR